MLVISSELPEIIGMCDRIYTMCEGRISGEVERQDASQELLMKYMTRSKGQHRMAVISGIFKKNIRQYGMIIALIFISIFFQILTDGILLKPLNVTNLILQNSYILVLAIGMVLVIITGHIDLSVGSVAAFIGALSAIMMVDMQLNPVLAVILSLLMGALVGLMAGLLGCLYQNPCVYRHSGRNVIVSRLDDDCTEWAVHCPVPQDIPKISSGFVPDIVSGGSLNVLTLIVGIILSVLVVYHNSEPVKSL